MGGEKRKNPLNNFYPDEKEKRGEKRGREVSSCGPMEKQREGGSGVVLHDQK